MTFVVEKSLKTRALTLELQDFVVADNPLPFKIELSGMFDDVDGTIVIVWIVFAIQSSTVLSPDIGTKVQPKKVNTSAEGPEAETVDKCQTESSTYNGERTKSSMPKPVEYGKCSTP